ncbi:MAG: efflux RND transporter periplasmic adaptor subunit [Rikenellaceae bacterium]
MNPKSFVVAALSATLFVATSCGSSEAPQQMAAEYKLMTVKSGELSMTSSYSAAIRGKQDIDIVPQVGGYLSEIRVTEGARVRKGDILFVIEQSPYRAALEAANASVEMAQAGVATAKLNLDNSELLNSKGIISDSEFQSTKNAYSSAQAQLSLAKAQALSAKVNYDFTIIKSPSDGVVGKLPYRQGSLVSASLAQPLTVVSDNSQMYVYFSMNERQVYDLVDVYGSLDSVVENMPQVELQLINGSTYALKGRVESISGVIDNSTGAVSLRASFPNSDQRLISGGAGNIIVPQTHTSIIAIPKTATYELQNKIFVYKVIEGVATSAPIEVAAASSDREYIVTEGLSVGDVIISEGAGLVREGALVKVE